MNSQQTPLPFAHIELSSEEGSVNAKPDGDGVFIVPAPWIAKVGASNLIFALQFAHGSLEIPDSRDWQASARTGAGSRKWDRHLLENPLLLWAIGGSFVAGVLLTLLVSGGHLPSGASIHTGNASSREATVPRVSDAKGG